jgi:hypothetical protein
MGIVECIAGCPSLARQASKNFVPALRAVSKMSHGYGHGDLRLDPSKATLAEIQVKYQLRPDQVGSTFGVVSVRPEDHLYAVLVDEQVASRIEGGEDVVGSFSNPKIETFGPPRKR